MGGGRSGEGAAPTQKGEIGEIIGGGRREEGARVPRENQGRAQGEEKIVGGGRSGEGAAKKKKGNCVSPSSIFFN